MGLGILQGFHMIIDGDGEDLGLSRDIPADHQYHTELTDGVGETQTGRGDQGSPAKGQHQAEESIDGGGPQGAGGLEDPFIELAEGVLDRLHHEGQGVEHRADHQAAEGEGEGLPTQRQPGPADDAVGRQGDQQIKTQHRGRQHQGERHHSLYHGPPVTAAATQPPGQRGAEQQQDECSDQGEPQGDPEGADVRFSQCLNHSMS